MLANRYGSLTGKNYTVVGGVVYLALHLNKKQKGWEVFPWCSRPNQDVSKTETEIKKAFIEKNGGRFIKTRKNLRWYP